MRTQKLGSQFIIPTYSDFMKQGIFGLALIISIGWMLFGCGKCPKGWEELPNGECIQQTEGGLSSILNPPKQDPPPKCTDPTGAEIPCPPEPPRPCNPTAGECPEEPPPCVPSTGMCYEAPECVGTGLVVLCSTNWATAYIVNETNIGGVCTRETRMVNECWRTGKKCNPLADLAKGEEVCN